jgi:hypothetical protein
VINIGRTNWTPIILIGVLLVVTGIISIPNLNIGQTGSAVNTGGQANNAYCGDDGLATAYATSRNQLSLSSADYTGGSVNYIRESTGKTVATDTVTTSATPTTEDNFMVCGERYKALYVNNASSYGETDWVTVDSAQKTFDVPSYESADLKFTVYFLNSSNLTSGAVQDADTNGNIALTTGDSYTLILDVETSAGSSQFGYPMVKAESSTGVSGQAFVCADFDLSKFGKEDVTLSCPFILKEESTLPVVCSANGYEKAWSIKPIKSSDGLQRCTIKISASKGDPSTSTDVKFYFTDISAYNGADGTLKYGTADDATTVTGETDRYITIGMQ